MSSFGHQKYPNDQEKGRKYPQLVGLSQEISHASLGRFFQLVKEDSQEIADKWWNKL